MAFPEEEIRGLYKQYLGKEVTLDTVWKTVTEGIGKDRASHQQSLVNFMGVSGQLPIDITPATASVAGLMTLNSLGSIGSTQAPSIKNCRLSYVIAQTPSKMAYFRPLILPAATLLRRIRQGFGVVRSPSAQELLVFITMSKIRKPLILLAVAAVALSVRATAAPAEWNAVRAHSVEIGPQADRLTWPVTLQPC